MPALQQAIKFSYYGIKLIWDQQKFKPMIQTVNNCSSKGATADDCLPLLWEQLTPRGMDRWIFASIDTKFNKNRLIDAGSQVSFSDRTTAVQRSILQFLLIIYAAQILNT